MPIYMFYDDFKDKYVYANEEGQEVNIEKNEEIEVNFITKQMECAINLRVAKQCDTDRKIALFTDSDNNVFCSNKGTTPIKIGYTICLSETIKQNPYFQKYKIWHKTSTKEMPNYKTMEPSEGLIQCMKKSWSWGKKIGRVLEQKLDKTQIEKIRINTCKAISEDIINKRVNVYAQLAYEQQQKQKERQERKQQDSGMICGKGSAFSVYKEKEESTIVQCPETTIIKMQVDNLHEQEVAQKNPINVGPKLDFFNYNDELDMDLFGAINMQELVDELADSESEQKKLLEYTEPNTARMLSKPVSGLRKQ